MIDLHIHTTASADAQHDPAQLLAMAAELGLRCIAFADHNTLAAVAEGSRLAREAGIEFIPAVELNTHLDGCDLHLLGYGIDHTAPAVRAWFDEITALFHEQARRRVARFVELGLELTLPEVLAQSAGRLPTGSSFFLALTAHAANRAHPLIKPYLALRPQGNHFIRFYFEVMADGPAAVESASLPTRETIARFLEVGAVPVVAHPQSLSTADLEKMIDAGLLGIEAICSYHDDAARAHWRDVAGRYRLLTTAGSDFHGDKTKPGVAMGGLAGADYALVEALREAIGGLA